MDTLFSHVAAVLMDDAGTILTDAYVQVSGKQIVFVGQERPEPFEGREIDGTGKVLMPGLVNAHTHVPMTLMRGYADGYDLQTWLNDYIFPAEARLDARAVRAGTALGLAEMIASGIASFSDMYYFCDEIVEETLKAGLCANISRGTTQFSPGFDPEKSKACQEMRALVSRWHGYGDGQIQVDVSIHGEYTSYDRVWRYLADYAMEHRLGMHVHCSETKQEHEGSLERNGKTPAQALDECGVWNTRAVAAHCVWAEPEDIALFARRGVTVAHNPVSNLKLGSGVAPVPAFLQAGVNVALGTDGVSSNNSHDLLEEVKLAAILHKGTTQSPQAVSPLEALKMATVNGARAQGRNSGRIAVGCDASLILLDFRRPHLIPCHDVASNVVYAARGNDVVMNMVRGTIIYENGTFHTIDLEQVVWEVEHYATKTVFGASGWSLLKR
ncbi:MAG: amidohydrolase family protein [Oscillospiraceae bacterium]|jgi:5-methylthioadenosine/S-adenosylhomocysteine deaminase